MSEISASPCAPATTNVSHAFVVRFPLSGSVSPSSTYKTQTLASTFKARAGLSTRTSVCLENTEVLSSLPHPMWAFQDFAIMPQPPFISPTVSSIFTSSTYLPSSRRRTRRLPAASSCIRCPMSDSFSTSQSRKSTVTSSERALASSMVSRSVFES